MRWFLLGFAVLLFAIPATAGDVKTTPGDKPAVDEPEKAAPDKDAEGDGDIEDRVSALEEAMESLKKFTGLEFYGHFKLDMAYDSSATNGGNTAQWVLAWPANEDEQEFNMTARHTRLGINYVAPKSWGPISTGKLEIDFYGGNSENAANVRLRHAWLQFDFGSGWYLLAGQTWDVAMPLWQWKLNTAVGWNQGNAAFRRPQLRGTKKTKIGEKSRLDVAVAIADPEAKDEDGAGRDDGEASGIPDLQGRVGFVFPVFGEAPPWNIGLGGIWGRRKAEFAAGDEDYTTWLLGLDITIPFSKKVTLFSEVWMGEALSNYRGGIGQSYNKTLMTEIGSTGGFVNVRWSIHKKWFVVLGAGIDSPKNGDLNAGNREKNTSLFGNIRFKITKFSWVGLEYDRMQTDYKDADNASNNRFQVSFILKW